MQRLDHAGGVLAAGHAQIQPRFLAFEDRAGIFLAVVAALAAILLRHRRHQLPAQRLAFGELHALGQRQRLVVPGRAAVVILRILCPARDQRGGLVAGNRRNAETVERHQPGEEAVEPGALLVGERRGLRHQRGERRRQCSASFRLRREHRLERVDLVPARKGEEGFVGRGAMREIALEHALDRARRVLRLDVAIDLAAEGSVRTEAAADIDVIALDLLLIRPPPCKPAGRYRRCNAARRNDGSR